MKKNLIFLFIGLSLSACQKERTCVPPAPGDTPFTVVPGIEIGQNLEQVILCPSLDTSTLYWNDSLYMEILGEYEGKSAMYAFTFSETLGRSLTIVDILTHYHDPDTAAVRIWRDKFLKILTEKYGIPRKEDYFTYINVDDFSRYQYKWKVCDGVQITLRSSTEFGLDTVIPTTRNIVLIFEK